jgi:hypothetical protein
MTTSRHIQKAFCGFGPDNFGMCGGEFGIRANAVIYLPENRFLNIEN